MLKRLIFKFRDFRYRIFTYKIMKLSVFKKKDSIIMECVKHD